ncbi:MAG: class I SAM-dependent methyltransferase [Candidatus Marinimicrobia bacterium]|nr:class I SAM-dependent methyltransferase [Candidatus Neomarinimicrobiota bacterium]
MNKSEKFWDRMSKTFDKPTKSKKPKLNTAVEKARTHLRPCDIILDYGCATGTKTLEIANAVKETHAIDISSKMIDIAKRKAGEQKIENVHFRQSSIFDKKYENGSFDVILAFNILHLLVDTHKVLKRINDLLKPGALFISTTPCMGEKMKWLNIFIHPLSKIGILPEITFFKVAEMGNLITDNNFTIIESEIPPKDAHSYYVVAKKQA